MMCDDPTIKAPAWTALHGKRRKEKKEKKKQESPVPTSSVIGPLLRLPTGSVHGGRAPVRLEAEARTPRGV